MPRPERACVCIFLIDIKSCNSNSDGVDTVEAVEDWKSGGKVIGRVQSEWKGAPSKEEKAFRANC